MKLVSLRGVFFLFAIGGAIAAAACSLNPQPIPPGEQPDGGQDFGSGTGGSTSDAATNTPTPGDDAGAVRDDDAGDAGETDASDAGNDDAGDADTDADAM